MWPVCLHGREFDVGIARGRLGSCDWDEERVEGLKRSFRWENDGRVIGLMGQKELG